MTVVDDAGVLVAAERGDRAVSADHRVRLETGALPVTTAPVVAQVSRSARQAQLRKFLRGCDISPFVAEEATGSARRRGRRLAGQARGGSAFGDPPPLTQTTPSASFSARVVTGSSPGARTAVPPQQRHCEQQLAESLRQ